MNKFLNSVKFAADHTTHVTLDQAALDTYVANFKETKTDHWLKACPFDYHPLANNEDELTRWFVSDALAFCFWGYPSKWTIDYQGQKLDGWWGLLAAIQRALENNLALTDASFLSNLSFKEAKKLFAGTPQIPLYEERVEALHNLGNTLVSQFGSSFANYLKSAPHDALNLVEHLANTFPIFDDVSIYQGEQVYFYKKAQLLVHDLRVGFPNSPLTEFTNLEKLTGEADYKIPALLRELGILVYSDSLAKKVDSRTELPADSVEEVEIRASMLWACQLICQQLATKRNIKLDPHTLDGILWVESQTHDFRYPYHLTLTTDY